MSKKIAVVYKDEALGLLSESFGKTSIEVLYWKKHSNHDSHILFVKDDEYRYATLEDFNEYRVCYNENWLLLDDVIDGLDATFDNIDNFD